MVKMHKIPTDFTTANVRDSFMKHYIDEGNTTDCLISTPDGAGEAHYLAPMTGPTNLLSGSQALKVRGPGNTKNEVVNIMRYTECK